MYPLFKKLFWKTWFRRKKKGWGLLLKGYRQKISSRTFYKFLFWKLTRKREIKQRLPLRLFPRISFRRFWFAFKSPQKPWWVTAGGITLGIMLLGLPAYLIGFPLLKEYKFHRFEKTAKIAFENGELHTALLTSQAAHLLNPNSFSALKTLVKCAERSKHPKLLTWQHLLSNLPEAGFTERASYLKNALLADRIIETQEWLNQVSKNISEKEIVYFQCLIWARQDDEAKFNAYQLASTFLRENPLSSPVSELFWDLSIQSDQSYLLEEAIQQMIVASKSSSSVQHQALRRLLRLKSGTEQQRKDWARLLWQLKNPSLHDAVLCLNATYGDEKINGKSLFNALRQDFPALREGKEPSLLIDLLNKVGRPQSASELFFTDDLNFSLQKQSYFGTIHSALYSKENKLAEKLISRVSPELSDNEKIFFDLLLFQGVQTQEPFNEVELAEMFTLCSDEELDTIRFFLQFFESPKFLLGFLEEMELRNPQRLGIKYLLTTSYHRLGMFEDLKNVLQRIKLPSSVSDVAGERQTCIQKTLYGMDIEACTTWAESAFAINPQSLANRFALALCYIQKNEPQNAQAILSPAFQNPPPICPTQRLIGALTLHRNNLFELSKKWAPIKEISLLTDAEKRLLEQTMNQ